MLNFVSFEAYDALQRDYRALQRTHEQALAELDVQRGNAPAREAAAAFVLVLTPVTENFLLPDERQALAELRRV